MIGFIFFYIENKYNIQATQSIALKGMYIVCLIYNKLFLKWFALNRY